MVNCQPSAFRKAFTLLELLIVISIIGILISVGVASFSQAQIRGRNSKRLGDMKAIQNAAEQYFANTGSYPPITSLANFAAPLTPSYLPNGAPTDPKSTNPAYSINNGGGTFTYCICATLEVNTGGNSPDTNCSYTAAGDKDTFCVNNLQ